MNAAGPGRTGGMAAERLGERWTLAIEVSNPSAHQPGPGVALLAMGVPRAGAEPVVEHLRPGTRQGDDLVPAIERCCARAGVDRRAIVRVGVSVGPGGYTALRTSSAAGATLAAMLGAEVVAVPTALVAAAALAPEHGLAAVCLASKGDRAHVSVVDARRGVTERLVRTVGVVDAAGFLAAAHEGDVSVLVGDGFVPESFRVAARAAGLREVGLELLPGACARLAAVLPALPDAAKLVPMYAREPDAVTQWRALGRDLGNVLPTIGGESAVPGVL